MIRSIGSIFLLLLLLTGSLPADGQQPAGLHFSLLPDVPAEIGLGGPLVGTHDGVLIVAGGANFPKPLTEGGPKVWHDDVYVLLPGAQEWRAGQKLPRPLAYASCTSTPRGIVVAGGSDADQVHSTVFLMRWDAATERVDFEPLPDLPAASAFGSAESIGDIVYLFQGKHQKSDLELMGGFWQLDLADVDSGWKSLPPHPGPVRIKMATAVQDGPDGKPGLYLFSGARTTETEDGDPRFRAYTDGYRYSPTSAEWTEVAALPLLDDPRPIAGKERFDGERWPISASCAEAVGTRMILTFSGSTDRHILDEAGQVKPADQRPSFLPRVLAYDTISDHWRDAGSMAVGVVTTEAVKWHQQIVIASGETQPGIRTPRVQSLALVPSSGGARFGMLDYTVLALYLTLMVAVGIYFARRGSTTDDFFLAGRKIPWWAAGLSVFGTQLSAITFMAIPATSYGSDWRRFVGSVMLLPVMLLVIYCFLPLFRRLDVTTAYEYLEARFSVTVRVLASAIFILFQLGRMGIVLLLPAIALSAVTAMDTYLCIALMGILATIYTVLGGISAVIWTDVLQVFVLIGGALLCLIVTIQDVGGWAVMIESAQAVDKFHIFDWRWSSSDMVAWVLMVGFLFTNLVPYTSDQTVIQRYLTTPDEKQAAKGLWLNLIITIPTGLLFYGLGTALYVYYTSHTLEQAMLPAATDQLVPWFVVTHLPSGVAGVVVAAIFAAAMSSLDSSMNSISAAVVNDFVGRFSAAGRQHDFLKLARRLTLVLGVIGTGAAMMLATFEIKYLFDFFQKVLGLFGGGLVGVFLLAVFTRRCNATGALAGLLTGAATTMAVAFGTDINFLLYAVVGSCTCFVVGTLVSLVTGGQDRDLAGLTLATLRDTSNGDG
ncbi:MAG: sodium/solute symporter [Planctomycetota bacterium]|nr:sodium/solute symporter [Planctomycetota bacterium]